MWMIAIKEIPGSVSLIVPGQQFIEPDPERARIWLKNGIAEMANKPPEERKTNRRGWDGLLWDDMDVCIMASGPSMSQEQANQIKAWRTGRTDRKVATINTTFRLAPWADVLYACDCRWWDIHHQEVSEKVTGERWTQDKEAVRKYAGLKFIASQRADGLSKNPGMINQGMNSSYQSSNLFYLAGVKRIIFTGLDCRVVDKKTHWHGDHPAPLNSSVPTKAWIEKFEKLAHDLKAEGVDVVNATPGTALHCFQKMSLTQALQ